MTNVLNLWGQDNLIDDVVTDNGTVVLTNLYDSLLENTLAVRPLAFWYGFSYEL